MALGHVVVRRIRPFAGPDGWFGVGLGVRAFAGLWPGLRAGAGFGVFVFVVPVVGCHACRPPAAEPYAARARRPLDPPPPWAMIPTPSGQAPPCPAPALRELTPERDPARQEVAVALATPTAPP
ncbi:hypothetical protein DA2_3079 [Desulfovibrio sp. A2]|nr:hypothetical protein DA2_3079 [Desulfovibrio sp. A2]